MSDEITLSVVIPTYRGKAFIRQTVDTVLKIKHTKQILVIDDGSPDDTFDYCRSVWADEPEVQVMSKKNGGIVDARNYGLKQAVGKYVIFVDHDDVIVPEVIDKAIGKAEGTDSELVLWSTERLYDSGEAVPCDTVYQELVLDVSDIRKYLLGEMLINQNNSCVSYIGHVWAALYRMDFIRRWSICFQKFVDIEDDYLFVFDCLVHAQKTVCIPEVGYYWRYNQKSETYRLKYIDHMLERYENLYRYLFSELGGILELEELKKRYILYIRQDVIVKTIENCFTILNSSGQEKRRVLKAVKQNREAFKEEPVQPYTKRRKRIFLLVRHGLPRIACLYVYLDSLYRQIRKKM